MGWARTARAAGLAVLGIAMLTGCAEQGPPVRVVADGGGAGYWPPDSRTAAGGAIELAAAQALDGLELGVATSADGVAMISRGEALEARRAATFDPLDHPHARQLGRGRGMSRTVGGEDREVHVGGEAEGPAVGRPGLADVERVATVGDEEHGRTRVHGRTSTARGQAARKPVTTPAKWSRRPRTRRSSERRAFRDQKAARDALKAKSMA